MPEHVVIGRLDHALTQAVAATPRTQVGAKCRGNHATNGRGRRTNSDPQRPRPAVRFSLELARRSSGCQAVTKLVKGDEVRRYALDRTNADALVTRVSPAPAGVVLNLDVVLSGDGVNVVGHKSRRRL